MSFGQRLRERRKELGISQGELAKALGVSLSAISNYENGQNAMREDVLLRLFRVLEIEPNYLYQDSFTGKGFTCTVEEERLGPRRPWPGSGRRDRPSPARPGRTACTASRRPRPDHLPVGGGEEPPGGGAPPDPPLPHPRGGRIRFPGVRGGLRLYRCHRGDAPGGGVCRDTMLRPLSRGRNTSASARARFSEKR